MHFSFSAGIVLGDNLFFSDNSINGLFVTDLIGCETTYIGSFQNEEQCKCLMHKQALLKDNIIYFVPNQGHNVHAFNVDTFEIVSIPIYKVDELRYAFSGGVIYEECLYIMPGVINQPVIAINLKTYEQEQIEIGLEEILKNATCDKQLFSRIELYGDKVYMPILTRNSIIEYSITQNSIEKMMIEQDGLANIYVIGNNIFMSTLRSGILYFDVEKKQVVEIKGDIKGTLDVSYTIIERDKDDYYAFPDVGGRMLQLKKTKEDSWNFEETNLYIDGVTRERVMGHLLEYGCNYNKGVLVFPTYTDELMIINEDGMSTINTTIKNKRGFYSKGKFDSLFSCGFQREGDILDLKDYMGIVSHL